MGCDVLLCLGLVSVILTTFATADLDRIRVDGTEHWFIDSLGRVRLFHGVNAVQKSFPWYPAYLLEDDRRVDDLEEWGMNILRLGTMWTGTEPTEGEFNDTYIEKLSEIIEKLADKGIYSMLDMHQDCLSSYYPPSYDGVPPWLIESFPEHSEEYPWPLEEITYWEQGYLTQGVSESFEMIYNNTEEALDKWANFWGFIAETYTGNTDVIGYNFINEPWVGDYLDNPELQLPGVAGGRNLMPTYDVLNEAIREHDSEGIVFYEPVIYGQLLHGDVIGSGFDRVPGGEEYIDVSAYSYHTYCWPLETLDKDEPEEDRLEALAYCINGTNATDTGLVPRMFESTAENVAVTGGTSILTEYGLCKTFQDYVDIECETYMELCDDYLQSWVEWDYNGDWYSGGEPIMEKVIYHVRPYAQATAGTPTYMHFDAQTHEFTFLYRLDLDIEGPTEIYVPDLRYPEGYEVELTEGMMWEVFSGIMYVNPDEEAEDDMEVSVVITSLEM